MKMREMFAFDVIRGEWLVRFEVGDMRTRQYHYSARVESRDEYVAERQKAEIALRERMTKDGMTEDRLVDLPVPRGLDVRPPWPLKIGPLRSV